MVDFHGWILPVQYESILAEHQHTRQAISLFDTCHMGQFLIHGPEVAAKLSEVLVQDTVALKVGRCRYGFLLNERGGILDDTIVMRLGEEEFFLVVNAGPREDDLAWIRKHLPEDVIVEQLTAWGKLDVQGPESFDLLSKHVEIDLAGLGYFGVSRTSVLGGECILSRTGYTGELGYEIFLPGGQIGEVFDALMADDRVKPAGLGARDSLRLEMCYPLYGSELSEQVTPLEADLAFFLPDKGGYIGAEALQRQRSEGGPKRRLAAFRCEGRRRAQPGQPILADQRTIGSVTSAAFSPSLGAAIGMGYVDSEYADPGQWITLETPRAKIRAEVGEKPLYNQGTCRAKLPA